MAKKPKKRKDSKEEGATLANKEREEEKRTSKREDRLRSNRIERGES